jgi:hypothetical protein
MKETALKRLNAGRDVKYRNSIEPSGASKALPSVRRPDFGAAQILQRVRECHMRPSGALLSDRDDAKSGAVRPSHCDNDRLYIDSASASRALRLIEPPQAVEADRDVGMAFG